MLDWIEEYMEAFGCDWETAARMYHMEFDPDYCPEDYEDTESAPEDYPEDYDY